MHEKCLCSVRVRGGRWEVIRLNKIGRDEIGKIVISELRPANISDWRDRRLKEVANASVAREINLISSVMTFAGKEWGYLTGNPVTDVRSLKKPPACDRVLSLRLWLSFLGVPPVLGQIDPQDQFENAHHLSQNAKLW